MKMQERIRRARRRAGLSQTGLAAAVDVRRSAVSNWESADGVLPSMQNRQIGWHVVQRRHRDIDKE